METRPPPGESFGADPIAQLVTDRERARAAGDPMVDVCILATTDGRDPIGAPGVRPLVLRDVGPAGVGLLVSASSPKWAPLAEGRYECLLLWLAIRRQYRIRGGLTPMAGSRVAQYWAGKAHASRLLDRYYVEVQPQSSEVASRVRFLEGIARLDARYPTADSVPRPDVLRGVYLVPERVEIWRGSPDRLHDRHVYTRRGAGWSEAVLVP
jgi:pyridoxamine 5'-phosphate oxidase